MRVSIADPMHRNGFFHLPGPGLRRNRASRHRDDGCAVGYLRLVNPPKTGGYPEKEL